MAHATPQRHHATTDASRVSFGAASAQSPDSVFVAMGDFDAVSDEESTCRTALYAAATSEWHSIALSTFAEMSDVLTVATAQRAAAEKACERLYRDVQRAYSDQFADDKHNGDDVNGDGINDHAAGESCGEKSTSAVDLRTTNGAASAEPPSAAAAGEGKTLSRAALFSQQRALQERLDRLQQSFVITEDRCRSLEDENAVLRSELIRRTNALDHYLKERHSGDLARRKMAAKAWALGAKGPSSSLQGGLRNSSVSSTLLENLRDVRATRSSTRDKSPSSSRRSPAEVSFTPPAPLSPHNSTFGFGAATSSIVLSDRRVDDDAAAGNERIRIGLEEFSADKRRAFDEQYGLRLSHDEEVLVSAVRQSMPRVKDHRGGANHASTVAVDGDLSRRRYLPHEVEMEVRALSRQLLESQSAVQRLAGELHRERECNVAAGTDLSRSWLPQLERIAESVFEQKEQRLVSEQLAAALHEAHNEGDALRRRVTVLELQLTTRDPAAGKLRGEMFVAPVARRF